MIFDGQRPGAEARHQGHRHADKGAEGRLLQQLRLFDPAAQLARGGGQLADAAPADRDVAQGLANHLFEFPDAEETGMVEDRAGEDALHPALDALDGVAVENPDINPVLGHPAGLGNGLGGVRHELQGGRQAGVVEGVVVEGQILRKAAVKIDPPTDLAQGDIQHVRGGVKAGDLEAQIQKSAQIGAGSASDVQHRFPPPRVQHLHQQAGFHFGRKAVARLAQPAVKRNCISKIKYIPHTNNLFENPA